MKMLQAMLHFDEVPDFLDASDALAAAVCHYIDRGKDVNYTKKTKHKSSKSDWSAFIAQNPDRVTK